VDAQECEQGVLKTELRHDSCCEKSRLLTFLGLISFLTSLDPQRYDLFSLILLAGYGWRPGGSDILWGASGR